MEKRLKVTKNEDSDLWVNDQTTL